LRGDSGKKELKGDPVVGWGKRRDGVEGTETYLGIRKIGLTD